MKNEKESLQEKLQETKSIVLGRKNERDNLSLKNLAALSRLIVMCSSNVTREAAKNEGEKDGEAQFKAFKLPLVAIHQYTGGKGMIGSIDIDTLKAVFYALNSYMHSKYSIELQWELTNEECADGAFTSLVKISKQLPDVEYSYVDGLKRDECRESSAKRGAKNTPAKTKPAEGVTQSEANENLQKEIENENFTNKAVKEVSDIANAIFKTDSKTLAKFEVEIAKILARYIEK